MYSSVLNYRNSITRNDKIQNQVSRKLSQKKDKKLSATEVSYSFI